ncbi:MAG: hypothetical protein QOJ11_2973 [Frankiales bacterium]|jgi:hypothetical protein|nr:hypothetical protein [Frankiales bacterium]
MCTILRTTGRGVSFGLRNGRHDRSAIASIAGREPSRSR